VAKRVAQYQSTGGKYMNKHIRKTNRPQGISKKTIRKLRALERLADKRARQESEAQPQTSE
jgi:hypothetical protein